VGWHDNPRPFFDSLEKQQKSGTESANSRTWYLLLRSHAKDSTNYTEKWIGKDFDPIVSLVERWKPCLAEKDNTTTSAGSQVIGAIPKLFLCL
jgi:hypothetical protein